MLAGSVMVRKNTLVCLALIFFTSSVVAEDELPTVEASDLPAVNFSGLPAAQKADPSKLGLRIEGDVDKVGKSDSSGLGLLFLGNSGDRVLYEDDHHQVIGNPARPAVRMMYRYDPTSTEWKYDGSVVRGHVARGSNFGWSVAVIKPLMAIMDWSAGPNVAAIVIYEKTPNSIRGWKKRFEVIADNKDQARCMGGLDANKWLAKWNEDRGAACGVRTVDGSKATKSSIQSSRND